MQTYLKLTLSGQGGKPTRGYKSNAYVIFNYLSPTNFKFAGVDGSTNKIEIGHFDGTNWIIDAQTPAQITTGTTYGLFLAINGNIATLVVNNNLTISYTYPFHVVGVVNIGLRYVIVGR